MLVTEKEITIASPSGGDLISSIEQSVAAQLADDEIPVRFVVTDSSSDSFTCEVGVLSDPHFGFASRTQPIFDLNRRPWDNANEFNIALLIPTGVGCEMGGHSGDGGAVARLFGSICDNLITHPNVVNAADVNELPDNGLYVEGSIITQLLMGTVGLRKVRSNRILMIVDEHHEPIFHEMAINSVSAARAAMGIDCPLVVQLEKPAILRALSSGSGRAVGRIECLEQICHVIEENLDDIDAVALSTLINLPGHFHADYFKPEAEEMVNPWGGVEAMLTHALSSIYQIPTAHAPMMNSSEVMNLDVGIVDPRKAAEAVSNTYLHCVLKGLHRAPQLVAGLHPESQSVLDATNISCLVIPDGCLGLPLLAAIEQGIHVIAVRDRHCRMRNDLSALPFSSNKLHYAENYLEAAGLVVALKAGVCVDAARRPLLPTKIKHSKFQESHLANPVQEGSLEDR
tara:strand:- start:2075 stop:3442 length:1368 start_codon:yes stop_codon:yes gene_type:complete